MCGEHDANKTSPARNAGSSPHVRGTHHAKQRQSGCEGIIPACAGNTSVFTVLVPSRRDHPRMCGEHVTPNPFANAVLGSSPHVRGTLPHSRGRTEHHGIIPACAGNTSLVRLFLSSMRDHPRMCGEHRSTVRQFLGHKGSSPHVRGTHLDPDQARQGQGIIPACAGNTPVYAASVFEVWDHPRMCGEHHSTRKPRQMAGGSSPHVRGTHLRLMQHIDLSGIIPACAGNTRVCRCGR